MMNLLALRTGALEELGLVFKEIPHNSFDGFVENNQRLHTNHIPCEFRLGGENKFAVNWKAAQMVESFLKSPNLKYVSLRNCTYQHSEVYIPESSWKALARREVEYDI